MRVKSKWNVKDKTHTVEEIGAALAFIAWRIAQNSVLDLENNDFQTDTQQQRIDIIAEYLAFTIHMIDRMTIDKFDDDQRMRFMTELAQKSAKNYYDNMKEFAGPGEYRQQFIDLLNRRIEDYAEFKYDDTDGPSFPMRRFFGNLIAERMGEKNKRWVADQIIDVEVPNLMDELNKAVPNLFM